MNSLKKGDYILINDHPCKVNLIKKSAPGKHGHAQYNVFGHDIVTNKKYNTLYKHHDKPQYIDTSTTTEYCTHIEDNYAYIVNDDGSTSNLHIEDKQVVDKINTFEDGCDLKVFKVTYTLNGDIQVHNIVLSVDKVD